MTEPDGQQYSKPNTDKCEYELALTSTDLVVFVSNIYKTYWDLFT